jgi:transglutaminase superfamily protein
MSGLVLRAYFQLLRCDFYLMRKNFTALHERVRNHPLRKSTGTDSSVETICSAMDMACIWYWKEALCLQRSAATVCLLRDFGFAAQLVIGAQRMPFKAHAWVEVAGRVVNDKPYMHEMYAVLDRC